MRWVSTGSECVEVLIGNDVHFRHRNADLLGKLPADAIEPWSILLTHLLRPIHHEHDLIGEEIGDEVHDAYKDDRNKESSPPEKPPYEEQKGCEQCQKDSGLELVHGRHVFTRGREGFSSIKK
jgi:hypothetical protein